MARSQYIYVVAEQHNSGDRIVAGFTVKHELTSWLKRHTDFCYTVTRVRDSALDPRPTVMDGAELLEKTA